MNRSKVMAVLLLFFSSVGIYAGQTQTTKKSTEATLFETTGWLSEFAPHRIAYSSSAGGGILSVPQPGMHEKHFVDRIDFNQCNVSIKKYEEYSQVSSVPLEPVKILKSEIVFYTFSLNGALIQLDQDDGGRGYQLLRIRAKPDCKNLGGCPVFSAKRYRASSASQDELIEAGVLEGGIAFEIGQKNLVDAKRIVEGFSHAAKICTSKKPAPF